MESFKEQKGNLQYTNVRSGLAPDCKSGLKTKNDVSVLFAYPVETKFCGAGFDFRGDHDPLVSKQKLPVCYERRSDSSCKTRGLHI